MPKTKRSFDDVADMIRAGEAESLRLKARDALLGRLEALLEQDCRDREEIYRGPLIALEEALAQRTETTNSENEQENAEAELKEKIGTLEEQLEEKDSEKKEALAEKDSEIAELKKELNADFEKGGKP